MLSDNALKTIGFKRSTIDPAKGGQAWVYMEDGVCFVLTNELGTALYQLWAFDAEDKKYHAWQGALNKPVSLVKKMLAVAVIGQVVLTSPIPVSGAPDKITIGATVRLKGKKTEAKVKNIAGLMAFLETPLAETRVHSIRRLEVVSDTIKEGDKVRPIGSCGPNVIVQKVYNGTTVCVAQPIAGSFLHPVENLEKVK